LRDDQNLTFICDPLLSEYGPLRPAILLAERFIESGKRITLVSTTISPEIRERLAAKGIGAIDLNRGPFLRKNESIAWMEQWLKEAAFSLNSKGISHYVGVVLNFSNTIILPAHFWYAQGPPTLTLDNMTAYLPFKYKVPYRSLSTVLRIVDKRFTRKIARCSSCIVSNSKYVASTYNAFSVQVDNVIYPPLNCDEFRPVANRPSEDFVLTYFGKETIFEVVRQLLNEGVKLKAFGGKLSMIPKEIRSHSGLDFLGRIGDERLVELYSNALFTLYPFNDEPFGYIPIESLACGTPVLTFNKQGPKESISDGKTGWLADTQPELAERAIKLWKKGYPEGMRADCRESALRFDTRIIAGQWHKLLENIDQ
jgi:glycosyltransferase involved in cell wall biosynthesis